MIKQAKGAVLIEVKESNDGPSAMIEPIEVNYPGKKEKLSARQGLLWAFDSLWFHKNGGNLYRVTDTDGDGKLDTASVVPSQTGGGEHGNHAVILTEDGQGIYMDGGNHAPLGPLTGSTVSNCKRIYYFRECGTQTGTQEAGLHPAVG